jgi:hypothetical protein
MATALREGGVAANAHKNSMTAVSGEWPYAPPERYIFRELTMELNNGLQFFYKDPGLAQPLPAGGIDVVIATLLPPPPAGAALVAAAVAAAGNAPQETPLDLKIYGAPTYVVLRLDPALNWRFSADGAAISLKNAGVANHYGGLRHVLDDGTPKVEPTEGCRLVYFAAMPPAVGANGQYRHGFNFHVELVQNSSGHSSEQSMLPIVIDPDVGYPGGSNT